MCSEGRVGEDKWVLVLFVGFFIYFLVKYKCFFKENMVIRFGVFKGLILVFLGIWLVVSN